MATSVASCCVHGEKKQEMAVTVILHEHQCTLLKQQKWHFIG